MLKSIKITSFYLFFLIPLFFSNYVSAKELNSNEYKASVEIRNAILGEHRDKFSEKLLINILSDLFFTIDVNKDGITLEEIQLAVRIKMAKKRVSLVSHVLLHDINGDGIVRRAEVESYFNSTRGFNGVGKTTADQKHLQRMRLRYVDRVMKSDPNQDGAITPEEYKDLKDPHSINSIYNTKEKTPKIAQVLLKHDPNRDGRVTQFEAIILFSIAFHNYEFNKKAKAVSRFKSRMNDYKPFKRAAFSCNLKKPSSNAKLVVYGSYSGATIPTVTVAGQDKETNLAYVNIEEGQEKLFLVMTSYKPLIWKFSGAVHRIEHIVFSGPNYYQGIDKVAAGSIGLNKSTISFTRKKCFEYFHKTAGLKGASVKAKVNSLFGRKPDYLHGNYETHKLSLPSGDHKKARRKRLVELNKQLFEKSSFKVKDTQNAFLELSKSNGDKQALRAMERFFPGGVRIVDQIKVVSDGKAEKYEVLPSQAGIAQLLLEGRLKKAPKRNTFIIVQPIRYPPGMGGAHSVKFHLSKGVPEPTGDPIHSCVYSEERQRNIEGVCR